MDLKGIMLNEMSERNKYCMISLTCGIITHIHIQFIEKEMRFVVTRGSGRRIGKLEEGSQKAQSSSYKINKY